MFLRLQQLLQQPLALCKTQQSLLSQLMSISFMLDGSFGDSGCASPHALLPQFWWLLDAFPCKPLKFSEVSSHVLLDVDNFSGSSLDLSGDGELWDKPQVVPLFQLKMMENLMMSIRQELILSLLLMDYNKREVPSWTSWTGLLLSQLEFKFAAALLESSHKRCLEDFSLSCITYSINKMQISFTFC